MPPKSRGALPDARRDLAARVLEKAAELDVRRDHAKVAGLPSLEQTFVSRLPQGVVTRVAISCLSQLRRLAEWYKEDQMPALTYRDPRTGVSTSVSGDAAFDRLALVLGTYLDWAMRKVEKDGLLPVHLADSFRCFAESNIEEHNASRSRDLAPRPRWLLHVVSLYAESLFSASILHRLSRAAPGTPQERQFAFDQHVHQFVLAIAVSQAPSDVLRELGATMALSLACSLVNSCPYGLAEPPSTHQPGYLSQLRLGEVGALAAREPSVVRRYGARRLELVYQHRLALIMGTLGFHVVEANVGERAIDLVCVSALPGCPGTIIVDAKSSRKPYSLSVSDAGALAEYAHEIRRRVGGIPPVVCLVIVGHSASRQLQRRLETLQNEVRVPVRFMEARALAQLREHAPGTIHSGDFMDFLKTGSVLLGSPDVLSLVKRAADARDAMTKLVRTQMLGLRGGN